MKNSFLFAIAVFCSVLGAAGCDSDGSGVRASPSRSAYTLDFPAVPQAWASVLGPPSWCIEWVNKEGTKAELTVQNGQKAEIIPPDTWASPVTAWPFWPGRGITPGVFKPAGAIVPFDISGYTVRLSWQGGVGSVFYWELAKALAAETDTPLETSVVPIRAAARLPQLFNWPRFRDLLRDESLNAEFRADPWLADWSSIAAKTVSSGFDKRKLVPASRKNIQVPAGPGPWAGVSPFAEPLLFEGEPVFPAREAVDTWVSAEALLRCNEKAWILVPWKDE